MRPRRIALHRRRLLAPRPPRLIGFERFPDGSTFALWNGAPPREPGVAEADADAYTRIGAMIGDLELVEPPPGWEDRAVARWLAARAKPDGDGQ